MIGPGVVVRHRPQRLQMRSGHDGAPLSDDVHLREGLNVCDGKITCKPVADAHGVAYAPATGFLG